MAEGQPDIINHISLATDSEGLCQAGSGGKEYAIYQFKGYGKDSIGEGGDHQTETGTDHTYDPRQK
jgi:hypothetical protein